MLNESSWLPLFSSVFGTQIVFPPAPSVAVVAGVPGVVLVFATRSPASPKGNAVKSFELFDATAPS